MSTMNSLSLYVHGCLRASLKNCSSSMGGGHDSAGLSIERLKVQIPGRNVLRAAYLLSCPTFSHSF